MKRILLFFTIIIFLSGCIDWNEVDKVEPLKISLESDLTRVRSNDITYLYLILDNLDKDEEYEVEAKIMNPGIFEVIEEPKATSLSGLEKETLEWTLQAPKVETETSSPVSVEVKLSKSFEFYLPIKFANPNYLREREQRGDPVPKDPKNYYFSDNLVSVSVTLNKNPPLDTGVAYANLEINSKIGGILDAKSVSSEDGNCYLDRLNTASCSFEVGKVDKIKEKKFKITIDYYVRITKSLDFVILPEVTEEVPYIPPEKPPPDIISLKDEKGKEIEFDIINSKVGSYYYVLGVEESIYGATLNIYTEAGGGIRNKEAELITSPNEDFCKLVEILEFSRSDNQLECTKTGFCILNPKEISNVAFCGIDNIKAKEYLDSIGLTVEPFSGSLLYDFKREKWCYVKDENIGCNDIEKKFNGDCSLKGELLQGYVNVYDRRGGDCWIDTNERYIKWYFSGEISITEKLGYSCMDILVNSPFNFREYKPSNCNEINKKWEEKYRYESLIYLRVGELARNIEITVTKKQKNQKS